MQRGEMESQQACMQAVSFWTFVFPQMVYHKDQFSNFRVKHESTTTNLQALWQRRKSVKQFQYTSSEIKPIK